MIVLGWVAIHLLFALAGGALLAALGLIRTSWRGILLALGPAYITGVASVTLLLIAVMVVGLPFTDVTLLIVVVVLTAAFAALALRRRGIDRWLAAPITPRSAAERWAVLLIAGATAVFVLVAGAAFIRMPTSWDPAHMWQLRAGAIYYWHGLVPDIFTNVGRLVAFHLDYPILQATWEAAIFHGLGGEYIQWIHVELWGLFAASLWTAAYLLAPGRRAIIWLPVLGALAVGTGLYDTPLQGNADLTLAMFAALGALGLGLWLERGQLAPLVLGGLFLAAAANAKKEGLIFAVAITLSVIGVSLVRRRRQELIPLASITAGAVLLIIPWLIYVRVHHLPSGDTAPLHTILSHGYLTGRLYRLSAAQTAVLGQFTSTSWPPAVPALLGLAAMCFFTRRLRRLAAFYVASATLMTCGLLWIYWTGTWPDINQYLTVTVTRVVLSIITVCALGAAQLGAGMVTDEELIGTRRTHEPAAEPREPVLLSETRS